MTSSGSVVVTRRMISLSELLPGTMVGLPDLPPRNASAFVSSRSLLFCWSGPWHSKHRLIKMGAMSRVKSIVPLVEDGVAARQVADRPVANASTSGKRIRLKPSGFIKELILALNQKFHGHYRFSNRRQPCFAASSLASGSKKFVSEGRGAGCHST